MDVNATPINPLDTILGDMAPLTLGQALAAIAEYVGELQHDPSENTPTTLADLLADVAVWVEAVADTQAELAES